jgi:hypothetical protein
MEDGEVTVLQGRESKTLVQMTPNPVSPEKRTGQRHKLQNNNKTLFERKGMKW